MPPQMPKPEVSKPEDIFKFVHTLAFAHAGCVLPALRSGAGSHAYHHCWLSPVIMFFAAGLLNCSELAYCIPFWFALVGFRRIFHDPNEHSQFLGYSWVFLGIVGHRLSRWLELPLVLVIGFFLKEISEPLGLFVQSTAVSLFLLIWTENADYQARRRIIKDAQADAGYWGRIQRGEGGW